jgi:hypothetical protein
MWPVFTGKHSRPTMTSTFKLKGKIQKPKISLHVKKLRAKSNFKFDIMVLGFRFHLCLYEWELNAAI